MSTEPMIQNHRLFIIIIYVLFMTKEKWFTFVCSRVFKRRLSEMLLCICLVELTIIANMHAFTLQRFESNHSTLHIAAGSQQILKPLLNRALESTPPNKYIVSTTETTATKAKLYIYTCAVSPKPIFFLMSSFSIVFMILWIWLSQMEKKVKFVVWDDFRNK